MYIPYMSRTGNLKKTNPKHFGIRLDAPWDPIKMAIREGGGPELKRSKFGTILFQIWNEHTGDSTITKCNHVEKMDMCVWHPQQHQQRNVCWLQTIKGVSRTTNSSPHAWICTAIATATGETAIRRTSKTTPVPVMSKFHPVSGKSRSAFKCWNRHHIEWIWKKAHRSGSMAIPQDLQ